MLRQRTIAEKIHFTGIGLHSGAQIQVDILQAPVNNGLTFIRSDIAPSHEIRAHIDNLVDTTLATTIGSKNAAGDLITITTIEHLLAALAGCGIDNAFIVVDGPEIPILDGSAAPFTSMLQRAGITTQKENKRFLVIKKELKLQDGERLAKVSPGSGLTITCSLDFNQPLIFTKPHTFKFSETSFIQEIARARTFGFLKDVEALKARGLIKGGSLENAIVIDEYSVLNPEGLRYPDEFVRHKILDTVGDLALLGMPLIGKIHTHRSGHAFNAQLVQTILNEPKAYEVIQPALNTPPPELASTAVDQVLTDILALFSPVKAKST